MTKFKHRYYLLPLPVLNLAHKQGLYNELKVYLYLKAISDGHLLKIDKSDLVKSLNLSRKQVNKAISILLDRNWIGHNPKNGIWHIRSLKSLPIIEQLKGRVAVWFNIEELDQIEAFIDASVVSEIVRRKKVEHWRAQQKGSAVQLQKFYEISVRYFANYTRQSDMTSQRRLKRARESKYLLFEKAKARCIGKSRFAYLQGYPEQADAVFYRAGNYYVRQGISYQTCMLFKRRRKCLG